MLETLFADADAVDDVAQVTNTTTIERGDDAMLTGSHLRDLVDSVSLALSKPSAPERSSRPRHGGGNLLVKRSNAAFGYLLRSVAKRLNISQYRCVACAPNSFPIATLPLHSRTRHPLLTNGGPQQHLMCPLCNRWFFYATHETLRSSYAVHLLDCLLADNAADVTNSSAEESMHGENLIDEKEADDVSRFAQERLARLFQRYEMIFSPSLMQAYLTRMTLPASELFDEHGLLIDGRVPSVGQLNEFVVDEVLTVIENRTPVEDTEKDRAIINDDDDNNDNGTTEQASRAIDRTPMTAYKRLMRRLAEPREENRLEAVGDDESQREIRQDEYVQDGYTELLTNEDGSCGPQFCCRGEIENLVAEARAQERVTLDDRLNDEFGRIRDYTERKMPGWLREMLEARIEGYEQERHSELFDRSMCGLSFDMVALSALLSAHVAPSNAAKRFCKGSNQNKNQNKNQNNPVMCHVFFYRSHASTVREFFADEEACYVLPHTCMCTDARDSISLDERRRKLHRHVIVVFRSAVERQRYREATSYRNCPTLVGSDLRQYCKEIVSRSHYFNVLRYVSREKTNDCTEDLARLEELRAATSLFDHSTDPPVKLYETFIHDQLVNTRFTSFSRSFRSQADAARFYGRKRKRATEYHGEDTEADGVDCEPEDDDDAELLSHAAVSHHFACSRPLCSFAPSLNAILSPNGLTSLFSFRRLTMPLYRMLIMRAFDHHDTETNTTSLAVRLGDVATQAGLTLFTHSLPYRNSRNLDAVRETNRLLAKIGMCERNSDSTDSRPLEEERVSLFKDFMNSVIVLDPKLAAEVHRTRRLLHGFPRQMNLMYAQLEQQRDVRQECARYVDACQRSLLELRDENSRLRNEVERLRAENDALNEEWAIDAM